MGLVILTLGLGGHVAELLNFHKYSSGLNVLQTFRT